MQDLLRIVSPADESTYFEGRFASDGEVSTALSAAVGWDCLEQFPGRRRDCRAASPFLIAPPKSWPMPGRAQGFSYIQPTHKRLVSVGSTSNAILNTLFTSIWLP